MLKKLIIFGVVIFSFTSLTWGQKNKDTQNFDKYSYNLQLRKLVDNPTAGLLPRGSFDFDIRFYPRGGVNTSLDIGLMRRFMIGMAYGAEGIIGEGDPNWNPRIEFLVKLRVFNESPFFPAIALGFDSQGYGAWDDSLRRYAYKSKGFFGVISKNYLLAEMPFGLHGGVNYSLENEDKNRNLSIFLGADLKVGNALGFAAEYDLATNDNKSLETFGRGRGYLNIAVQWFFMNQLQLEADLKNILQNRKDISAFERQIRIIYFEYF